jgi:hypothetical protein
MKQLPLVIIISILVSACSIKSKKLNKNVVLENCNKYGIIHKTADCEAIQNGVMMIDTSTINRYQGHIWLCGKCLSDEDIKILTRSL